MSELNLLVDQLQRADKAYWEDNQPIMTDADYDKLVERIRVLSPDEPILNRVNGVNGNVRHNPPMLSLNKVYSHVDLVKWIMSVARDSNETFLVQPKYDGIAGKLEYTNYNTSFNRRHGYMLSTRGDGHLGENITDKLAYIEIRTERHYLINICLENHGGIPPYWFSNNEEKHVFQNMPPIYGEIVITNDNFDKYFRSEQLKRKDGTAYTTPRNAVAGLVNSDDMPTKDRILTFVDYDYISNTLTRDEICDINTWTTVVNSILKYPYPCDGVVIKLADKEYANSLGSTIHHPRGAMAYKFTNSWERSVITDIIWTCGMQSITPVAILKPVIINDVTITKASLFNMRYVLANNFCVGDHVAVERAGDVIPHIKVDGHVHNGDNCVIPDKCPSCGAPTVMGEVELTCSNKDCPGTALARLAKAVNELKIDGFGIVNLKCLINKGVLWLHQLLALSPLDIKKYLECSDLMAEKLYKSLQAARTSATPADVLSAMGIPMIGKAAAKKVLTIAAMPTLINSTYEELVNMGLTQKAIYASVADWLKDETNQQALAMACAMCTLNNVPCHDNRPTVCFTGAMSEPRNKMEQLAIAKGYRPVDDVTKDLSILVVPDTVHVVSSKVRKAEKYNIEQMSESKFRSLEE